MSKNSRTTARFNFWTASVSKIRKRLMDAIAADGLALLVTDDTANSVTGIDESLIGENIS